MTRGILSIEPSLGIIEPNMGTKTETSRRQGRPALADALFSKVQQRVLAVLFGNADRSFYANEIISLAQTGTGAVQRELARLAAVGLLTVRRQGNQKHYQANRESPVFDELRGLVLKTSGLADVLRSVLEPLAPQIQAAFVYGSVAKSTDTAASDIDLMIVSDTLSYAEVIAALERAAKTLGRTVNPTVYSQKQFARRLQDGKVFVRRVMEQRKVWLIGNEHAVAA